MRHLVVIAAALAMMLAVQTLGFSSTGSGVDPRTLAAVGFVILASFSVGGIVAELTLPKIIGYIVTGIALGPAVSDVLSVRVVREMQVFNTLALGLIALGAGLELDLRAIARVWKTLFSTVLLKVPLLLVLVGGAFLALHYARPMLPISDEAAWALALLLAVLGIGTSPAIALAVVRETSAKGRLTDILLAMVVVKDLVVVVLLAVSIGIAKVLLDPAAELTSDVLVFVAQEIGGSIVLGVVLAVLLLVYIRFVHREMLLVITASVLLAAEVCEHFHLELLLVFITVGFVVRNFSKAEHQVLEPLERVALPVFVVFFTTAGAALDVNGVLRLLPLGFTLVVARAVAYWIASRLGGLVGREQPAVATNAWLAYVPQAGVTLGLVFLTARALPSLSSEIASAGMSMVGINLLVGPVLLGLGLKRAGELPKKQGAPAPSAAPTAEPAATTTTATTRPPSAPRAPVRHAPLRDELAALERALASLVDTFLGREVVPALRLVAADALDHIRTSAGPIDARGHATALARRILDEAAPPEADLVPASSALVVDIARGIEAIDALRVVRLTDDDLRATREDPMRVRTAKLFRRAFGGRRRTLRLRVLARASLELPLAEAVTEALRAATFLEVAIGKELKDVLEGTRDAEEAAPRITQLLDDGQRELRAIFTRALEAGLTTLTGLVDASLTPGVRAPRPRLSTLQARAEARVHALPTQGARLRAHARAAFDTVRAEAALFVLTDRLDEVRRTRLAAPLASLVAEVVPEVDAARAALAEVKAEVATSPLGEDDVKALAKKAEAALSVRGRGRVRRATARHRRETQANVLLAELMGALPNLPERVSLLASLERPSGTLAAPIPVELAQRVRERLEDTLHRLQELNQPVLDLALPFASQLEEAIHVASFSFDVAGRGRESLDDARQLVVAAIDRAVLHISEIEQALVAQVEKASAGFDGVIAQTTRELEELARIREGTGELMRTSVRATRRRFFSRIDDVGRALRRQVERASGFVANVRARSDVQEYLLRVGRERFDAAGMREFLDREVGLRRETPVPGIYEKLFALDPLDDARLFATHRAELEEIIALTARGRAAGVARLLIVGDPGTGRSTLLQAVLRRLSGVRVIVVDPAYHPRGLGVVSAIAEELSCQADVDTVAQRLAAEPTVVLVDDLERHLPTGAQVKPELERLRALLRETMRTTHFVVNIETPSLAMCDELAELSSAFAHVIRLPALDAERLKELVERRRRLAGLKLTYDEGFRLFGRSADGSPRPERRYFERLAHASRGNLRTALLLHLKSVQQVSDDTLLLARPLGIRIPFLRQLGPSALATLGVLSRTGPLGVESLARALLVDADEAANLLSSLELAGLVVERPAFETTEFEVPPAIAPTVTHELRALGVLPGGTR